MDIAAIWIALTALLLGSYFAACHVALKTYSRSKLSDLMEAKGKLDRLDRFLQRLAQHQLLTGTARTCLNLVVLLAVLYFFEHDPYSLQPLWRYLLAFAVAGVLVTAFGVAIPLSLGRHAPEKLLARSMFVLAMCEWLFRPVAAALHVFDPIVRRMAGGEEAANGEDAVSDKIMTVVQDHEAEGEVDSGQKEMIEAVFDLTGTTAGEIMTPRTEVTGIEVSASLAQVKQTILSEGHSRIPVYEGNLDHIVGVLYAKDLLQFLGDGDRADFDLRPILREALMVPQSKWIRQLLAEFRTRKVHIAIVLDEYGGTAGLITIEDIIEELVGDIEDEYEPDEQRAEIRRIDDKTYEVDARVHVDDLNDDLNIHLPEDEGYDTVGGFVFSTLGHIPDVGEGFDFHNARFTVTEAERTKVSRVRIEVSPEAANSAQGPNGHHG